ncbi:hypothetical protein DFH07DRAFT_783733 [Mycena maculata]|uniref:Uncharacterized protein n=1 Tax=Mycena maculata TaxID=230809 RepID=A0AAD7HKD5_9AGAR|nr:hypothetical protein DFH07DRAFT_783733 [Mycena maculata]
MPAVAAEVVAEAERGWCHSHDVQHSLCDRFFSLSSHRVYHTSPAPYTLPLIFLRAFRPRSAVFIPVEEALRGALLPLELAFGHSPSRLATLPLAFCISTVLQEDVLVLNTRVSFWFSFIRYTPLLFPRHQLRPTLGSCVSVSVSRSRPSEGLPPANPNPHIYKMASNSGDYNQASPDSLPPTNVQESSFGSITDDFSAYDENFFTGVQGLETPDKLQMPKWSYMPSGGFPDTDLTEEELAEIDGDPTAAEVADHPVVEDDEEDELDKSPIAQPSPLLGRKRPLDGGGRPVVPIRFLPPPAEEQLGGGYPCREATPPRDLPATHLRGTINPTARAYGNQKTATMHTLRKQSTNQTKAAPPPPSSRPEAAPPLLTAVFPAPTHPVPPPNPALSFPAPTCHAALSHPFLFRGPARPATPPPHPAAAQRVMSDEPDSVPIAQARAEATPESKRCGPSAEPSAVKRRKVDQLPLPPDDPLYKPAPLPPPPLGFAECKSKQGEVQPPLPPRLNRPPPPHTSNDAGMLPPPQLVPNRSLTPVAEAAEPSSLLSPAGSDFDADAVAAKDTGGRPSKEGAEGITLFTTAVHELAAAFSKKYSLSANRFLAANIYQRFARSSSHASVEYQHINPAFNPNTMDLPQLTVDNFRNMYAKFQKFYAEEWEEILEQWGEMTHNEGDETLGGRQRLFDWVCKDLRASINAAHEKDFEAILFMCGSYVHEDSELAEVIATPALETAFSQTFKHAETGSPFSNPDLLGIAKISSYSARLASFVEPGVVVPDALLAALDGPRVTKTHPKASPKASPTIAKTSVADPSAANAAPAIAPRTFAPSSAIVSNAVAGPSTTGVVKIDTSTATLNLIWEHLCRMSSNCLGFDLFHESTGRPGNFIWIPLAATLSLNNLRLLGFPVGICNTTLLNVALQEHESGSGWGIRLERHAYTEGHDYSVPAPQDPKSAALHWETLGSKFVRCQDAQGSVWSACVDVRKAGDASINKSLILARIKEEPAGKQKQKLTKAKPRAGKQGVKTETVSEEEDDEEPVKAKGKGKGKRKAVSEEEDDDDEGDEEPVKAKGKGKGKGKRKVVAKKVKRRAPAAADMSDFFDEDEDEDNAPEDEDPTSLPPPKKLRSSGPAIQQGGSNVNKTERQQKRRTTAKPVQKQVSFTSPASPPAIDRAAVVNERRKRMAIIQKPDDDGREFLVAKPSAAPSAPPTASGSASTVHGAATSASGDPLNAAMVHLDSLNAAMAQLAHVPKLQLTAALLQLLQGTIGLE